MFGQSSVVDINVKCPLNDSLLPCLNSGAKRLSHLLFLYMHRKKFDTVLLIIIVGSTLVCSLWFIRIIWAMFLNSELILVAFIYSASHTNNYGKVQHYNLEMYIIKGKKLKLSIEVLQITGLKCQINVAKPSCPSSSLCGCSWVINLP